MAKAPSASNARAAAPAEAVRMIAHRCGSLPGRAGCLLGLCFVWDSDSYPEDLHAVLTDPVIGVAGAHPSDLGWMASAVRACLSTAYPQ